MRFLTLVILCAAASSTAAAQLPPPPSDGSSLQGWKVEHTTAETRDGALHVGKGNGWVRTEYVYADFALSLDVRVPANGDAAIFVRAWPTFSGSSTPTNGYRLKLTVAKPAPQSDAWQRVELECVGRTMKVRVNGELVQTIDDVGNPQGYVALSAPDQTVQFKAIAIRSLPRPRPAFHPEIAEAGPGSLIQVPKPLFSPKPRYTADAMRARINGNIIMQGIVLPDGSMGDVQIMQSLDPQFGLDEAALETARQWTFSPGTRDGQPVAVRIMLELSFNLR
jgi:protein TonB